MQNHYQPPRFRTANGQPRRAGTKEPTCEATRRILEICLGWTQRWPGPPNWSCQDWSDEARQVGSTAAWKAALKWASHQHLGFSAFLQDRIMSSVRVRYRQEWKFGTRFVPEEADPAAGVAIKTALYEETCDDAENCSACRRLRLALASLSPEEQRLLTEIFWEGHSERELAEKLHIGRRAVNKRKAKALSTLRERFGERDQDLT